MTHAPQPDLGPLNWVKGEIDLALARSVEALDQAGASAEPASALQFAQTHLHQARGALSIVGLDGLAQFADALDRLLASQAKGELEPTPERLQLARRGLAAVGNYLDELSHGAPDQPLRLGDLYAEIGRSRGEDAHPADLFFPDLALRPPRRETAPDPLPEGDAQKYLKALRGRFERGLLKWLRAPADPDGPREMREAVAGIEARQASPTVRNLWWASLGFFDSLMAGAPTDLAASRKLCTRIDAQMRRLLSGAPPASDRVMREVLHHIATHPVTTDHQQQVIDTFRLVCLLPAPGTAVRDTPLAPVIKHLRETLAVTREAWDEFSAGTAAALPRFAGRMDDLAGGAQALGRPPFTRLVECLTGFTDWLRKDPLRLTPSLAMEVASTLLLAESALDASQLPPSFVLRVDETIARIQTHMGGQVPSADLSQAAEEATRRHEERDATAQLARELLTTLAQVEQELDAFFRNPSRREPLAALAGPLAQLAGALMLVDDPAPRSLVEDASATIQSYADAAIDPDPASFEALAHQLSALGFYLEALRQGPARLADFLPKGETPVPVAEPEPIAIEAEVPSEAPLSPPVVLDEPVMAADEEEAEAVAPIPPPSAETQALMAAPEEALDAELLSIFIEEAEEVLGTLAANLALSRSNPADLGALTTVRRSFHTLKGSGRMVGLTDLGEAAWALEQTLNRWLQLEWQPTPALYDLIDASQQLFAAWVEQLKAGGSPWKDARVVVAEAERLRASETPISDPAPAPTEAPEGLEPALDMPELTVSEEDEVIPVEVSEIDRAEPLQTVEATTPAWSEDLGFDLDLSEPPSALSQEATLPEPADLTLAEIEALEAAALEESTPVDAPALIDEPEVEEALEEEVIEGDLESLEVLELSEPLEGELSAPTPVEADTPPPEEEIALEGFEALDGVESLEEPVAVAEAEAPSDTLLLGDKEISRPLYDLFLAEARQHLATLRRELARLHVNPTLLPPDPAIRAAHTLAGIAGTAQVEAAQHLARALEHAQNRLHDTAQPPSADQADILTAAAATLEAMVAEVAEQRQPLPAPELVEQLESVARLPMAEILPFSVVSSAAPSTPRAPTAPVAPHPTVEDDSEAPVARDDLDEQLLPIFQEEGADLLAQISTTLRDWRTETDAAAHPENLARLLHTLKGSARMAGAMVLGAFVHHQESLLENALDGGDPMALIDEIETAMDTAGDMIQKLGVTPAVPASATPELNQADAVSIDAVEGEMGHAGATTLRVRADMVDRFVNEAGEIGIARTRVEGELRTVRRSLLDLTENVIRLRNQLREVEIQAEVQMQSRIAQAESHHANFDPLEMDRYTRLQELTRMMAESVADVTTVQQNLLRNLDGADAAVNSQARLSRDLQQALMRVRMVRFDSLADRLYRVIRQSAKDLGKRANLDLRGGAIEIDRGVLEHMTAPLEHLLRNAVAHGIEDSATRIAAGKPEIGQITLTVSQEGNEIVLDLADDGAGLNFQRILEKARSQGILAADEAADEKRLTNLIFVPGFSTASSVSAVSGRGVGMDVVKSETAAVGGRIDVQSAPSQGTHFRVYLPLTLTVTQALLVRAGHRTYAIPSSMVAQVMEMKPEALEGLRQQGSTDWMGDSFSYRYLPRLLGDRHTQPEVHKFNWVLLLRAGAQTLALHVDGLRGNQEIVVKNAGPQLARIVGLSGATVLGDGEIVLILNPVALASRHLADSAEPDGPVAYTPEVTTTLPTVMVVDDSLTVRKITGRLLEREGYRVVTAKDGVDALEKLLDETPDVILSDIEMPRMDGFDLVRNIRADKRLSAVPIIMITSRLADKHRRYAMEVGANHYLGKPYQEDELLELIRSHMGTATQFPPVAVN